MVLVCSYFCELIVHPVIYHVVIIHATSKNTTCFFLPHNCIQPLIVMLVYYLWVSFSQTTWDLVGPSVTDNIKWHEDISVSFHLICVMRQQYLQFLLLLQIVFSQSPAADSAATLLLLAFSLY